MCSLHAAVLFFIFPTGCYGVCEIEFSHMGKNRGNPDLVCENKCFKFSSTFLFLFSNKMLVIRAGNHNMLIRIANREDPDQTASSQTV